jgi:hypothetical protein
MTHAHMYRCWVIRTTCVIIKGTIQLDKLIVAIDHSCKCRYLNWLIFSNRFNCCMHGMSSCDVSKIFLSYIHVGDAV